MCFGSVFVDYRYECALSLVCRLIALKILVIPLSNSTDEPSRGLSLPPSASAAASVVGTRQLWRRASAARVPIGHMISRALLASANTSLLTPLRVQVRSPGRLLTFGVFFVHLIALFRHSPTRVYTIGSDCEIIIFIVP